MATKNYANHTDSLGRTVGARLAAFGWDAQPPTSPTLILVVAKSPAQIDLAWTASTDNVGVAGYQVLRNGPSVGSVGGSSLAYSDSMAAPGTTYTYSVRAFDAAANYSPSSPGVKVTTPAPPTPSSCPGPAQDAFTGCYYNNTDLSGTPALVRTDAQINFNWTYNQPDPVITELDFSAKWQRKFSI